MGQNPDNAQQLHSKSVRVSVLGFSFLHEILIIHKCNYKTLQEE